MSVIFRTQVVISRTILAQNAFHLVKKTGLLELKFIIHLDSKFFQNLTKTMLTIFCPTSTVLIRFWKVKDEFYKEKFGPFIQSCTHKFISFPRHA